MAACISCSFAVAAGMAALSVAGRGAGPSSPCPSSVPRSILRSITLPSVLFRGQGRAHLAVDDAYMERAAWRQGMMAEATEP